MNLEMVFIIVGTRTNIFFLLGISNSSFHYQLEKQCEHEYKGNGCKNQLAQVASGPKDNIKNKNYAVCMF